MSRTLIDTNVILRYLLDDDEEQSLLAEHVINGDSWTTPEVLAEVTYVLDSVYNLPRDSIYAALCIIDIYVSLEPQEICKQAIKVYGNSNLDFVDCMLVAYDESETTDTFTFDKGIIKHLSDT